jgi:hypothetical protein
VSPRAGRDILEKSKIEKYGTTGRNKRVQKQKEKA